MSARRAPRRAVCLLLCAAAAPAAQPERRPQRIVSSVPAVTEMLFAIGAGPQVAAVSSFDRSPEAAGLPRVGALLDPDVERIFSLRPDLVVLYDSQVEQRDQLARAGVPVFPFRHGGLADVTAVIRALGTRTGRAGQAEKVAAAIEADLDRVRAQVAGRPRPRTLLVFGREPNAIRSVYASGGIGFLHEMLDAAGGANVFAGVRREAAQPSSETILAARPEVVVELRAAGVTENRPPGDVAAWERLPALPAVRSGRVHALDGDEFVVPGPRIAEAAERLARLLHPEAWREGR